MFKVKRSRLHFDDDENVYIVVLFDLLFCFISFFVQSKFRLGLFTFRFVICLLPNV